MNIPLVMSRCPFLYDFYKLWLALGTSVTFSISPFTNLIAADKILPLCIYRKKMFRPFFSGYIDKHSPDVSLDDQIFSPIIARAFSYKSIYLFFFLLSSRIELKTLVIQHITGVSAWVYGSHLFAVVLTFIKRCISNRFEIPIANIVFAIMHEIKKSPHRDALYVCEIIKMGKWKVQIIHARALVAYAKLQNYK